MLLKRVIYSSWTACLLLSLFIFTVMLFEFDALQSLEYKVYDIMARLRHREAANSVVMIAIDDASIKHIGSWPWPRSYIADMVRRLSNYGTHTLGIGLLYSGQELNEGFQEIQNLREKLREKPLIGNQQVLAKIDTILADAQTRLNHDDQLIGAVKEARNVVLPLRFGFETSTENETHNVSGWLRMNAIDLTKSRIDQKSSGLNPIIFSGSDKNKAIVAAQITQPFSELSRKAGALGHINLIADPDRIIRKLPLIITYQNRDFLAFALQVARKHIGISIKDIHSENGGLHLKHLDIPTDKNYQMLIDYGSRHTGIEVFSFSDVFYDKIAADAFRKKIVLIGITASGISPRYKTTLHSNATEIEIAAHAIENLVNRQHVFRPVWAFALEVMVLAYFAFFLLFVIPRVDPRVGLLILAIFLMTWIGVIGLLFVAYGYWLHVIPPIVLAVVGFSLTRRKKLSAEKQHENIELNKTLGLSLQSQGMLDMAFEKFLKCPIENHSIKELVYNLGLDFERKRMFNKALAVYRHILKAGQFKDIKERIKNLKTIEKSMISPVGTTTKKDGLLLENSTTKPTLGRYEIIQVLGQGAMGTVYLGKDPSINREVAIKTLNYADVEPDQLAELKSRFFREAEAAGKLSHPNIVTIFDVGEDHDMAYIAMELLRGKDLTHYCQKGKLLPLKRVLHVIASVAEALDYAHHQGVVHRDIKPANIILQDDDQVKVADFGIARVVSSSKTQTGVIFGTPNYMSPEQVAGKKVDGRSDLFSLGVVFYELLSAKKPFQGDNLTALMYAIANGSHIALVEVAAKTPPCCLEIVDTLLEKGVSKRFQTAAQVVHRIRQCREQVS